jgi:hypothetical protein
VITTPGESEQGTGWLSRLIAEMGQAARAGNAQTARLTALLAVAAVAVALVVLASRWNPPSG